MKNRISNHTKKKLILAVLTIGVLGLCVLGWYYFIYSHETFISANELKAKTAAIPPAPDKTCESPGDPQFVGQNYSMCCPDADKTPNCICKLPWIKTCQQKYKDCLAGQVFSKESTEYLGLENMPAVCKKLMDGCVSGILDKQTLSNTPVTGMKPDLSNSDNAICQVADYKKDDLPKFCGQICEKIPGCQYYQTDALMGSCGLFKGQPVPLEKGAVASTAGNYQLFMSQATKDGFADTTASVSEPTLGQAAKFCLSGAVDKCSTKAGTTGQDCLCSHSVINDCQKLHQECLKADNSQSHIKSCQAQFGGCCGIVDTTMNTDNSSMATEGKIGNGRQADILCIPPQVTTLSECKTACLKNTKCTFISSNLSDSSASSGAGSDRRGLTNDGLAPFCHLFSGSPLTNTGVMLGQKIGSNKNIYMKQPGNPDEREINSALAKK